MVNTVVNQLVRLTRILLFRVYIRCNEHCKDMIY
jgi:hypothetical protein